MTVDLGVYSIDGLRDLGIADHDRKAMLRAGSLTRVRRGWFATANAHSDAVSAVRAGGAVGCVSALRHHGFWIPPGHDRLHVRTRFYRPGQPTCMAYGPPALVDSAVDSPLVALGSAARCLSDEDFVIVADSILNATGCPLGDLRSALSAAPQRVQLLLEKCDARAQSGSETAVRLRLRSKRIQVAVQPFIRGIGWVDMLAGSSLIIEADSKDFHTKRENYQEDHRRDRVAAVGDYRVLRLTHRDIFFDWDAVFPDVMDLIRRRVHRRKTRTTVVGG
jgi:very-short-patch-repair endonuclease